MKKTLLARNVAQKLHTAENALDESIAESVRFYLDPAVGPAQIDEHMARSAST